MKIKSFLCLGISTIILATFIISGCTKKPKDQNLSEELVIYNWEDYFGETTIKDFEKEFRVKVILETFKEEEELLSGLTAHPDKYDLFVVSGDSVAEMIEMRLLANIDLNNIPNIEHIDSKYLNRENDPDNKHSIPYLWGTTGIAVNRKFITEGDDSWSILWNPEYKGKIAMLNSHEEVVGAALKYLGYSLNSSNAEELNAARNKLLQQKPLVVGYLDAMAVRDKMISNELWATHIYSGDGMAAADENEDIEYIIPREGAAVWIDNFCISRDAKHKYTAEVFINYVLRPKVSAKIANYLWYANSNISARPYTDKEILESSSLYPPQEVLDKCEFFKGSATDEEEATTMRIINEIWATLLREE